MCLAFLLVEVEMGANWLSCRPFEVVLVVLLVEVDGC